MTMQKFRRLKRLFGNIYNILDSGRLLPKETQLTEIVEAPAQEMREMSEEELKAFNAAFIKANDSLSRGNTVGLREGLAYLENCLRLSKGTLYQSQVANAVSHIARAYGFHDVADRTNPFLGIGEKYKWQDAHYNRDSELRSAWHFVSSVNDSLKFKGLGWRKKW